MDRPIRLDLSLDEFKALATAASFGSGVALNQVTDEEYAVLQRTTYLRLIELGADAWNAMQDRIIKLGVAQGLDYTIAGEDHTITHIDLDFTDGKTQLS